MIVRDPKLIHRIAVRDFDNFVNRVDTFDESFDRILGQTLPTLRNRHWRDSRSVLSQIFTSAKMKMMFDLLTESADDFIEYLKNRRDDELIVDAKDLFAKYTINGIATCALGFKTDCLRNDDEKCLKIATDLTSALGIFGKFKIFLFLILPKVYKFFNLQFISCEAREFLHEITIDEIKLRQLKQISRNDVIQLLLQAKEGQLHHSENDLVMDGSNKGEFDWDFWFYLVKFVNL